MTSIHFLFIALAHCMLKSYLTYNHRSHEYYIYFTMPMSIFMVFMWAKYAKLTQDNSVMYWNAIVWDLVTLFGYNILPLIFFGVHFSLQKMIGIGVITAGILIFKFS